MTFLARLITNTDIVHSILQAERDAEARRWDELAAVMKVQSFFRGIKAKRRARTKMFAIMEIQRIFRGWRDRALVAQLQRDRMLEHESVYFGYAATLIQKCFRGYLSRRHKHDFYQRKAYLAEIAAAGEQTLKMMEETSEQLRIANEASEQERAERAQQELAHKLHHLVGTKNVRGVFASQTMAEPYANVRTVEDHLRALRQPIPAKEAQMRSKVAAARPIRDGGFVRAADPYHAQADQVNLEKKIGKALWLGTNFKPKANALEHDVKVAGAKQSVHINTSYVAPKDIARPYDRTRFVAPKPFITATQKDRDFHDTTTHKLRTRLTATQ